MKFRSKKVKRNTKLAILEEQCPNCTSKRVWASKTNIGKKCTKCHSQLK